MAALLSQGAEAKVYLYENDTPLSPLCQIYQLEETPVMPPAKEFPAVMKYRIPKLWRDPSLDHRLRKSRHKQEIGCIMKAFSADLPVPRILAHDPRKMIIWTDYIEGTSLKVALNNGVLQQQDELHLIFSQLGTIIAKLHNLNIIHEDLTTSNILLRSSDRKLFLIDFGLSHISLSMEDKAVDLYVLERTFLSTHSNFHEMVRVLLDSYFSTSSASKAIFKQLELGIQ